MPQDTDTGQNKRVAPISSSAFSFSLGAQQPKKVKSEHIPASPLRQQGQHLSVPQQPCVTPRREASAKPQVLKTPVVKLENTAWAAGGREDTPLRQVTKLETLPSPFALVRHDDSPGSSRPRAQQRINAVLDDAASPFHLGRERVKHEKREYHGVTAAPRVDAVELAQSKEKRRVAETDEGLGVSPRKVKGAIQHYGPGPPPSVRLAALLSSASTSVILFYTSLQHTLYPSKGRPGVKPRRHIRTSATLRLQTLAPLPGPTHSATIIRCKVTQWEATDDTMDVPETVLVVFQALPNDCPRVGVDPRVVVQSRAKAYDVGVWSPRTDSVIPREDEDGEEIVVFASRYLIAEAEQP